MNIKWGGEKKTLNKSFTLESPEKQLFYQIFVTFNQCSSKYLQ